MISENVRISNASDAPSPRVAHPPDRTRLLLIDCTRALDPESRKVYDVHHPPVGLMSLAAYVRESRLGPAVDIAILDSTIDYTTLDELRALMEGFAPDIVGLRCLHLHTDQFHTITRMAKELASPALTIGGGPYASAAPIQTLEKDPWLDLVVVGEGEATLVDLLEAFQAGRDLTAVPGVHYRELGTVRTSAARALITDLDTIPHPDWRSIDLRRYENLLGQAPVRRRLAPVMTTRGCPYRCTYCHELFQKRFRVRSAQHLVEELKLLADLGVEDISIIDDIFNLYPERVIEIFNLIIRENLKFRFYYPNGLRGDRMTHEVIDAMVEGGSVLFTYALESGSKRIQHYMKKLLHFEPFYDAVDYTIRKGVMVDMFLMVGFPTETEEEARKTIDFVMQWDEICFPYLNVLNFFPGTEVYDDAMAAGHALEIADTLGGAHQLAGIDVEMIRAIKVDFLRNYFLRRSRLEKVIPIQRKYLREDELLEKYKAYLPMNLARVETVDELVARIAIDRDPPKRPWTP